MQQIRSIVFEGGPKYEIGKLLVDATISRISVVGNQVHIFQKNATNNVEELYASHVNATYTIYYVVGKN